jgi:hypothetical protein
MLTRFAEELIRFYLAMVDISSFAKSIDGRDIGIHAVVNKTMVAAVKGE